MSNQVQYDLPSPTKLTQTTSSIEKSIKNPNANASKIQELFSLPDFQGNKLYQANVKEIIQLMSQFDTLTDNLQAKVDKILIAQQNQFIQSYKQHMKKIEVEFKLMEDQVQKQEDLIKYYENEGKMSNLIKKVTMLEQQSKRLYAIIEKKQKQLKTSLLEIKVQKQENKRLCGQIKDILKSKNQTEVKLSEIETKSKSFASRSNLNEEIGLKSPEDRQQEHIKFFTTELAPEHNKYYKRDASIASNQNKRVQKDKAGAYTYNLSEQSILCPEEDINNNAQTIARKKLADMILKNRQLSKFNSKILQSRSQLETLFVNAVNEIKKQITVKRKIKLCTYEDFKKQDKINLLLTIISNQQILRYLYQKIFYNRQTPTIQRQSSTILQTNPRNYLSTLSNHKKNRKQKSILPYI